MLDDEVAEMATGLPPAHSQPSPSHRRLAHCHGLLTCRATVAGRGSHPHSAGGGRSGRGHGVGSDRYRRGDESVAGAFSGWWPVEVTSLHWSRVTRISTARSTQAQLPGFAKPADQLFEGIGLGWRELEPGEEVELLVQIAAVVAAPGHRGQVGEPDLDVPGPRFKNRAALVLGEFPPFRRLADRDEGSAGRLRPAQRSLVGYQCLPLGPLDVALVAGDPA